MEEAQENTEMFKSMENEKKVDKDIFKEEGKCQLLNVRMEKTSFSALNCFNVKLAKSNMRQMSKLKIA